MSQPTITGNADPKPHYPLYANLDGCRVVVVGAGTVAARKVTALLACGADVTVIAPRACDEISSLAGNSAISYEPREYRYGDLEGAILCIAATSNRKVNEAVSAEAHEIPILVNVVDVPELCNFIVPSTLKRGMFQIAVTTGGAAPTIAQSVRQDLEDVYPQWWEEYIAFLAQERSLVKSRVTGAASVRAPLYAALDAEWLRELFASGETPDLEDTYERIVTPLLEGADV